MNTARLHEDGGALALTLSATASHRVLGGWDVLHGDNQLPLVLVEASSICPSLQRGNDQVTTAQMPAGPLQQSPAQAKRAAPLGLFCFNHIL